MIEGMKLVNQFNAIVDKLKPNEPLTRDGIEMLMLLTIKSNPQLKAIAFEDDPMFAEMLGVRILLSRIERLTSLKLTIGAAFLLGSHLATPGEAVIYAYYLNRKAEPHSVVDIDTVAKDLFPWGMISDDQNKEIWDAQKLDSDKQEMAKELICYAAHDNLLDYEGTWEREEYVTKVGIVKGVDTTNLN